MKTALVTGAGGFIGSHLVKYLKNRGYWVRGVDIKYPEFDVTVADEFIFKDLRTPFGVGSLMWKFPTVMSSYFGKIVPIDEVYALAANMGGIGFIETHKAEIVYDNALINLNTIEAAKEANVGKYLFSSSACIYPIYKQQETDIKPLKEEDAYPADPEDGYGWEKLYMERVCRHYREDYGLDTRIVRFHNIFGSCGTFDGGREKSPAAICRKIALAENNGTIEVWGDGQQTRSYCHIKDCVEGIYRLMQSNYTEPLNLGTDRLVSINELVDIVANIAKKTIYKNHITGMPLGVRGRNSNNDKLKQILIWEPEVSLEEGLSDLYWWIVRKVEERRRCE